jgi:hypothetical protein
MVLLESFLHSGGTHVALQVTIGTPTLNDLILKCAFCPGFSSLLQVLANVIDGLHVLSESPVRFGPIWHETIHLPLHRGGPRRVHCRLWAPSGLSKP